MGGNDRKRRNDGGGDGNSSKKSRDSSYKQKYHKSHYGSLTGIESGYQGLFATCERGRESRGVGEMYRLLEDCASKLYGLDSDGPPPKKSAYKASDGSDEKDKDGEESEEEELDIEAAMKKEIADLSNKKEKAIISIKLDAQCVTFFRLKPPCDPVEMVAALCEASTKPGMPKVNVIQRLTPVSRTGRATLEGLEELAKTVLEPYFHREGQEGIKFAIRPTARNHNVLKRDEIIQTVARCVGPKHSVDLKNPDLLILVELYKNICGISVVKDFEKYKRFNIRALQDDAEEAERLKDNPPDVKPEAAGNDTPDKVQEEISTTETETKTESKD
ncbi:hypothetical protein EDC01DRAFT_141447 [Geopyxis carbonaria]|nr:hypothetical protein EDC01DRAFT_141447 [Geopyxis carbonaria]